MIKNICATYADTKQIYPRSEAVGTAQTLPTGVRHYSTCSRRSQQRAFSNTSYTRTTKKLGLIGARGYTGKELIRILNRHPHLDLAVISSRELASQPCETYTKSKINYSNLSPGDVSALTESKQVDIWVMALPNGICAPFVEAIQKTGRHDVITLDLSADYRFSRNSWVYGLPELYGTRQRYASEPARWISNPGCYATGGQLALAPLVRNGLVNASEKPVVFGVSGYSGAGTSPSRKNDLNELRDNIISYSLTGHIHENEISDKLGVLNESNAKLPWTGVAFVPHVGSWFQGIHLTVHVPLSTRISKNEIKSLYDEYYRDEPLIKVSESCPEIKDIAGNYGVEIGGFGVDKNRERVVVIATIDNLLKGAAGQAIQV